jgi:hypothetical protein
VIRCLRSVGTETESVGVLFVDTPPISTKPRRFHDVARPSGGRRHTSDLGYPASDMQQYEAQNFHRAEMHFVLTRITTELYNLPGKPRLRLTIQLPWPHLAGCQKRAFGGLNEDARTGGFTGS